MHTRLGPILRAALAFVVTASVAAVATGCIGVRTKMRVPDCATVTNVDGEHLRYPGSVGFDHGGDFALTKTRVVVEHEDGSRTTAVTTNGMPDIFHLFGGGVLLVGGGALFSLYALDASESGNPFNPETFLLAPLGLGVAAAGIYLGLTGWSPTDELKVPSKCGASTQGWSDDFAPPNVRDDAGVDPAYDGLPPPGENATAVPNTDDDNRAPAEEGGGEAPPPPL